ncbi:MAG: hypothetical protein KDB14_27245 [Planctomycetales bacterium]|nr:hypothetical protein [Planctomycetales bacterium]
MRGVLAHPPQLSAREFRQVLMGSGLDCDSEDIVPWEALPTRLGQQNTDVVVAVMSGANDSDWAMIEQGKQLTSAPLVVVGPTADQAIHRRARGVGASGVIDLPQLRQGLDDFVAQVSKQLGHERGKVISVFAPMAGSGATTVAANLAAAIAYLRPEEDTGLIELAREFGDLAMMLDIEPSHAAEDVCQRWRVLDPISLRGSLQPHRSGLRALVNSPERAVNDHLHVNSVRRLAVLSRVATHYAVLALDNRVGECEIEALKLSDHVLLVVRPDVPSVKRAHWALTQATEAGVPGDRFILVVNRASQRGRLSRRDIESALNLPIQHRIPDDPGAITRATNRGQLVRERSPLRSITRRFATLARDVM